MHIKHITDLLPPDAWATYITALIAVAAIIVGAYQFKKAFRQNKKVKVFEDLGNDLAAARKKLEAINTDYQQLVNHLANTANQFASAPNTEITEKEINRRLEALGVVSEAQKNLVIAIHSAFTELLDFIQKIEKSTFLGNDSKQAARLLFHLSTDQSTTMNLVDNVLITFNVVPPVGENPNITSETFNKFKELVNYVSSKNSLLAGYVDDLEVIIHNELVSSLFGRAKPPTKPQHLTPKGITDSRAKDSLF